MIILEIRDWLNEKEQKNEWGEVQFIEEEVIVEIIRN